MSNSPNNPHWIKMTKNNEVSLSNSGIIIIHSIFLLKGEEKSRNQKLIIHPNGNSKLLRLPFFCLNIYIWIKWIIFLGDNQLLQLYSTFYKHLLWKLKNQKILYTQVSEDLSENKSNLNWMLNRKQIRIPSSQEEASVIKETMNVWSILADFQSLTSDSILHDPLPTDVHSSVKLKTNNNNPNPTKSRHSFGL